VTLNTSLLEKMMKVTEWRRCSGVARKKQMEVGYFVCKEGSKAVGEKDTWSRGR